MLKPIIHHEEAENMANKIPEQDDALEELWLGPTKCDEKRTSRKEELNKVWEIVRPMLEKSNFVPSTYHVVHLPLDLFREAQNCYQNGAYLATCGMCRVTIEALVYFAASRKPLDELNSDTNLIYINKKRLEFLKKVLEKEILDNDDVEIVKEIWEAGDFVMHIHQRIDGNLHNFATQISQRRKVDDNSLKGWSDRNEALKILNQTASLISKVMRKMSISQ